MAFPGLAFPRLAAGSRAPSDPLFGYHGHRRWPAAGFRSLASTFPLFMKSDPCLEQLVRESAGGDRESFDRITRRFHARIQSLVRLRIGPSLRRRVDVDDVVQETFLRAFRAIDSVRWEGERAFQGWLCTIAERTCTDTLRQHVLAEKQSIEREVRLPTTPVPGESHAHQLLDLLSLTQTRPSGHLRREERLGRLERAMDSLPARHREVLLLSVVQRMPTQEVARRLEMTSQAVCMLRTRALRKLRDLFGETESLRLPDRRAFPDSGESSP